MKKTSPIHKTARLLLSACFAAIFLFGAREAMATTPTPGAGQFRVCLRADMTGLVDRDVGDRAAAADLPTYGIRARVEKYGSVVKNWFFVDPDDACFLLTSGIGAYVIKVKPRSTALGGNNTLRVNDKNGNLSVFSVVTPWIGSSQTTYDVVLPSKGILRIYTVLAFSIERAFRGRYDNTHLLASKGGDLCACAGVTGCTRMCVGTNGNMNINIDDDHHTRRFVIAHEYGHATMRVGVGSRLVDCAAMDIDIGPGHNLRSREASSCAAMEGYAHFVSGDVFNWHNAGTGSVNPQAELKYADDGVWNLGDGTGACPSYPITGTIPNSNARKIYIDCSNGVLDPTVGVEMDWARAWWDYHEDTFISGSVRNHSQIHDDLGLVSPWGSIDTYEQIVDDLYPGLASRFADAAEWNGICEGSSC